MRPQGEDCVAGTRREIVTRVVLLHALIVLLLAYPLPAGASDADPLVAQAWCSLYEGDGVSSPGSEGWTVRAFGSTSISAGTSGGDTVAIVDDPTSADGAWMQRFMNFEPPFELSVRARYDPTTTSTGWVQMAYVFTGTHVFAAT